MKICIVYGTKRGSTKKIAKAMKEALEKFANVELCNVSENPDIAGCDLIILGTPIYFERPIPEVPKFISAKNGLDGKDVAIFVLCTAGLLGKLGKIYSEKRYVRLICSQIKGRIIARKVFNGWIYRENEDTVKDAKDWAKRVLNAFQNGEIIEEVEHEK